MLELDASLLLLSFMEEAKDIVDSTGSLAVLLLAMIPFSVLAAVSSWKSADSLTSAKTICFIDS
ncbi:hypothetical protein RV10_GL004490 [Enterococcus pallens]|nr:hypothetical protein RV10_GL004490 [Enterococcus pallens]